MSKMKVLMIIAALLIGPLFACQTPKKEEKTGVLDRDELEQSETLYGQNKEMVFHEYKLTDEDAVSDGLHTYFTLSKTRSIGGLPFLCRLAFNLPSEYCGQDLEYVGEPESTNDKEILKAIKLFYEDMRKKYGQPDNDPDVIRPHLADWIENNPGKVSSSNDTWQLTEKTVLTLSVGVLGDRVHIIFSYRQN